MGRFQQQQRQQQAAVPMAVVVEEEEEEGGEKEWPSAARSKSLDVCRTVRIEGDRMPDLCAGPCRLCCGWGSGVGVW